MKTINILMVSVHNKGNFLPYVAKSICEMNKFQSISVKKTNEKINEVI